MNQKTSLHLCQVILVGLFACQAAMAAESSSATVEPYLERSTLAIARVDLTKVDINAAMDWAAKRLDSRTVEQARLIKSVSESVLGSLKSAGASDVYVSLSLEDLAQLGVVVYVPCNDPSTLQSLFKLALEKSPGLERFNVYSTEGLVVVSQENTWTRLSAGKNSGNKELLSLLESVHGSSVSAALSIPDRLRKELTQIWPDKLPNGVPLKLSPKSLVSDIRALRLSLEVSGQPSAAIHIDTPAPEAVDRIRTTFEQLTAGGPALPIKANMDGNTFHIVIEEPMLDMALQVALKHFLADPGTILRQSGLAMMEYEQQYAKLPPRETRSKDGKPLLSWRVHVLPYMGQKALYDQFHLDEPWDSPHNAALILKMPSTFALDAEEAKTGKTRIQVPMMKGSTYFGGGPQTTIAQMTDGANNTIAILIAPKDKAVIWTQPKELDLDMQNIQQQMLGDADSTYFVTFAGSVRKIVRSMTPDNLKALVTLAGNDYEDQGEWDHSRKD